jgi:hypothetical protein
MGNLVLFIINDLSEDIGLPISVMIKLSQLIILI